MEIETLKEDLKKVKNKKAENKKQVIKEREKSLVKTINSNLKKKYSFYKVKKRKVLVLYKPIQVQNLV